MAQPLIPDFVTKDYSIVDEIHVYVEDYVDGGLCRMKSRILACNLECPHFKICKFDQDFKNGIPANAGVANAMGRRNNNKTVDLAQMFKCDAVFNLQNQVAKAGWPVLKNGLVQLDIHVELPEIRKMPANIIYTIRGEKESAKDLYYALIAATGFVDRLLEKDAGR